MKKTKIWSLLLMLVLVLTLSACGGSPKGQVSYQNYVQIKEGITTYNEAIVLLGQPSESPLVRKHVSWNNYTVGTETINFTILFNEANILFSIPEGLQSQLNVTPAFVEGVTTLQDVITKLGNPTSNESITTIAYSSEKDLYNFTIVDRKSTRLNSSNV